MFQYACGKAVAHRLGAELYLDLSWFKDGNRTFMLDAFPNIHYSQNIQENNGPARRSIVKKIMRRIGLYTPIHSLQEPGYSYWPEIENIQSSAHLSGYWQNEKYFLDSSSVIRQNFQFCELSCPKAENVAQKIKASSRSIGIHIRRGDYVENASTNSFHGICCLEYYSKALQRLTEGNNTPPDIFIFSDDPVWAKNNFNAHGYPSEVVDIPSHEDAPYHDMHLMSLCKHLITANSSFSWWAAWLSDKNGTIIAPKRWFAEETMRHHNPSPSSWITI